MNLLQFINWENPNYSYSNYSSFGIITKWTESSCCSVEYYPQNMIFDLMIIIPILILGHMLIKKLLKRYLII